LASFTCSGGCGEGEGGVSGGEVAHSGELPPGDDERGVLLVVARWEFSDVFGGLALAVGAAFTPDRTQRGGVPTALRSKMSATPPDR